MLNINCLLKNTSLVKDLHDIVEYMGYDRMATGKDPSVTGIFKDLRKAGVEVDLRTVGELYKNALSHQSENFTQSSQVDKITGRDMEVTLRNFMLQKPLEGEEQIGKMPPEQFIANGLVRTLHSNLVTDNRTKSIMRELQDAAYKQARRMVGELPNEKGATPETWKEAVEKALALDNKGYNTLEGTINNAHTLFEGMKEELRKVTDKINTGDNEVLKGQWDDYVKSIEDATYSLLLSKEQAKNVLYGALKEAGYAKDTKNGTILDWNKLAGNINDIGKLRETVRSVMEANGYHPDTAIRIADALQKEYIEMRGKMLERAKNNSDKIQASWDNMTPAQKKEFDLNEMINERLKHWDNYKSLSGDNSKKLELTKGEGLKIISEALKSEGFGKALSNGKTILDWTKLAGEIKEPANIQARVEAMLSKKGYSDAEIKQISEAIQRKYEEVRQDILDHAKKKLDVLQENAVNPKSVIHKGDLQRLAELHDLGIFNGAHDELLNHVAGIDSPTRADINGLANIGKLAADLSRELGGKNYLATPMFSELQRQVNKIIARNIANRTRTLKVMSAIGHYFQLENMGLIGNAFNMMENNLSGAKEMFAANLDLVQKVGGEAAFKDGKLLRETWKHISAGGAEYGSEPGRFGQHDFIADKFNVADINKNTFKDIKKYPKVLATAILAPAKAYLNGSDGAFKASIHKKTFILALHKALIENGIQAKEASHILNEALYGQSLEQARVQAKDMLTRYNQNASPSAVERLANNLVIQNLNSDGRLSTDNLSADQVVEAAYKSSYHVASLGMGHASNNPFSRMLLSSKAKAVSEESKLIRNERFGALAYHRLMNTVWHQGVFRFMAGGANWAMLRAQSGFGLGLVTGYLGKFRGADELNFDTPEKLHDTMTRYLQSQREIKRAMVGLGFLALNAGIVYGYGAMRKKKEDELSDEGAFKSAYTGISSNYVEKRMLSKIGADVILLDFLANTGRSANHGYMEGVLKYVQNNFNIGNTFSAGGQFIQAGQDVFQGEKGYLKAKGDLGQIAGNMVEVPFYRSYKQAGKLFNYAVTGKDPKPLYMQPYSAFEGLLGGGLLEDAGVYHRNSPVYAIPGVGEKMAGKAAADGIYTIDDLKKNPGWLNENLSGKTREKAVKVYNEVYGGDKGTDAKNSGEDSTW